MSSSTKQLTVLAMGDSLTHSKRNPSGEKYTDYLEAELNARLAGAARVTVVNAGFGGETADEGAQRFAALLAEHRPDAVILEYGNNDPVRSTPPRFAAAMETLITTAADCAGDAVLLISPTYTNEALHMDAWGDRRDEILARGGSNAFIRSEFFPHTAALAERFGLNLCDIFVTLREALGPDNRHSERYLLPDGIHWTADGNRLIATAVADLLAPMLRRLIDEK